MTYSCSHDDIIGTHFQLLTHALAISKSPRSGVCKMVFECHEYGAILYRLCYPYYYIQLK